MKLAPETIADLQRCAAEQLEAHWGARTAANKVAREERLLSTSQDGRALYQAIKEGRQPNAHEEGLRQKLARHDTARVKLRSKADRHQRQAKTILKVLEWAAPDKHREGRLKGKPPR